MYDIHYAQDSENTIYLKQNLMLEQNQLFFTNLSDNIESQLIECQSVNVQQDDGSRYQCESSLLNIIIGDILEHSNLTKTPLRQYIWFLIQNILMYVSIISACYYVFELSSLLVCSIVVYQANLRLLQETIMLLYKRNAPLIVKHDELRRTILKEKMKSMSFQTHLIQNRSVDSFKSIRNALQLKYSWLSILYDIYRMKKSIYQSQLARDVEQRNFKIMTKKEEILGQMKIKTEDKQVYFKILLRRINILREKIKEEKNSHLQHKINSDQSMKKIKLQYKMLIQLLSKCYQIRKLFNKRVRNQFNTKKQIKDNQKEQDNQIKQDLINFQQERIKQRQGWQLSQEKKREIQMKLQKILNQRCEIQINQQQKNIFQAKQIISNSRPQFQCKSFGFSFKPPSRDLSDCLYQ